MEQARVSTGRQAWHGIMRLLIVAACLVACKGEPPAAQVLDSPVDEAATGQLRWLFFKLIGREPGLNEKSSTFGDDTYANLKTKTYAEQIAAILGSDTFYQEGFWHFHEDRLLLGAETAYTDAFDRASLKLEMADVARSDNYWDIFTYRDRYLPLNMIKLRNCTKYLTDDNATTRTRSKCASFLQAVLHPEAEHRSDPDPSNNNACLGYPEDGEYRYKARKFTSIYKDRCCASIAAQDTEFCQRIDGDYTTLFEEGFCSTADKQDNNSHCVEKEKDPAGGAVQQGASSKEQQEKPSYSPKFDWDEIQIDTALLLYSSLHLSEGSTTPIEVAAPSDGKLSGETYKGFLKVMFPAELQGLHASPLWLSTHYISDNNQHLHRARIIYHSWFCEGISPDQATADGGGPKGDDVDEFVAQYFPKNDKHAQSHKSCYDCHKMVQPLANYFGKMSVGQKYEDGGAQVQLNAARFFQEDTGGKLPLRENIGTGYYNLYEEKFYGDGDGDDYGHNVGGMAGLAKLLSQLPKVKSCVVKYTWNRIFGCQAALSEKEISDATLHLTSYQNLLTYLLNTDKARAYFIPDGEDNKWNGEDALMAMVKEERAAQQSLDCQYNSPKGASNLVSIDSLGKGIVGSSTIEGDKRNNEGVCARCHYGNKSLSSGKLFMTDPDASKEIFNEDISPDFLTTIYRRTNSTEFGILMPMGGYPENAYPGARQIFKCFIERKAEEKGVKLPELSSSCATIDHQKIHRMTTP